MQQKRSSKAQKLPKSLSVKDKYALYEYSVQSPETHIEMFTLISKDLRGKEFRDLREDFCGSFWISTEWVKFHDENTALGLDLDTEPLEYGKLHHWNRLKPHQQRRLVAKKGDVLNPTSPLKDLVVACNFSFNIFKDRGTILKYFQSCLKSLRSNGLLILEAAGGPGMITLSREQKSLELNRKKFTYFWDQKSFDPITHSACYAIHFKIEGHLYKDVFVYDWRLWSLPELQDLLKEAGFRSTHVYWETSHKGEGTGEYIRTKKGDNAFAWVAYVVGAR